MSSTLDTRVLEMQFDNTKFESNMKTSLGTIETFEHRMRNMNGATTGLDNIDKSISKVDFSPMSKGVDTIKLSFNALEILALDSLIKIKDKVVEAGKSFASAFTTTPMKTGWQEYELKMGSIQTIMAGTGESLETVNKYLDELNKYSDDTIYSFADMTQNIGKFTNAGLSLETSVGAIKGVANAAALSGANANEASRAMYNFAQALSAGHVKLIDWKSIENANMATVEFKTQLLEAAVAAGTLEKSADGMYTVLTTNAQGKAMPDAISATKNFNDSLQYQWMTTTALTNALNDYADETTNIGARATKAATEVKTFSMLMDTLSEALQSGWATTWEIIFGDFTEGLALWTEISTEAGKIISDSTDSRNKSLRSGLRSTVEFKVGTEDAKTAVVDLSHAMNRGHVSILEWHDLVQAGKATVDFKQSLLDAGVAAGKLEDAGEGMYKVLSTNADGGTMEKLISSTDGFSESLEYQWLQVDTLKDSLGGITGRERLIDALRNSFRSLLDIMKPVSKAYSNVFPPITGTMIYNVTKSIEEFTSKLKLSGQANKDLQQTLEGVFSIFSILGKIIGGVATALKPLLGLFTSLTGNALGLTGELGKNVKSFNDWLEKTNIIGKAAETVAASIQIIVDVLKEIGDAVVGFIRGTYTLEEAFNKIKMAFKNVVTEGGPLESLLNSIKDKYEKVKKSVMDFVESNETLQKVLGFLSEAYSVVSGAISNFISNHEGLSSFVGGVKSKFNELKEAIETKINTTGIISISTIMEGVGEAASSAAGLLSGAWEGIKTMFGNIKTWYNESGAKETLGGFWELIKRIGELVLDLVHNIVNNIDFNTLVNLFRTGALAYLIPSIKTFLENMGKTQGTLEGIGKSITGVFESLTDAIKGLQKDTKPELIKSLAIALALLAGAIYVISNIDSDKLGSSLKAISVLLVELTVAMAVMNKFGGDGKTGNLKSMSSLISISLAMVAIANALVKLNAIDIEKVTPAVIAMGVLMVEIVIMLQGLNALDTTTMDNSKIIIMQMIGVAAAINLLADPLVKMGSLNWKELVKGVAGVGAVMFELSFVLQKIQVVDAKGGMSTLLELIGFAVAVKILMSAIQDFADMRWQDVVKGLVGVTALIAALGVFGKLLQANEAVVNTKSGFFSQKTQTNMLSIGVGLIAVGAALKIIASATKDFANMNIAELAKGLMSVVVVLETLSLTMRKMPNNMAEIGVGILAVSAALHVIERVVSKFSGYSWPDLLKGLTGLAVVMIAMTVPLKQLSAQKGSVLDAGVAILALAVAFRVLAPALERMGQLSMVEIGKAMLVLAGTFAILGAAGWALAGLDLVILNLSKSFALIGIGAVAIAAALMLVVLALSALAVGGAVAATAIVAALTIIIVGLAKAIPIALKALLVGLASVVDSMADALLHIFLKVIEVLVTSIPALVGGLLELLLETLSALAENIGPIVDALADIVINLLDSLADKLPALIDSGVNFFAKLFSGIMDALAQADPGMLSDALKGFLSIAGIMAVAAGMSLIAAAAMKGIIAMGLVAIELTAVLAILGGIQSIPGVSELADKGGELLGAIGNAIGLFIGSMIGGFGEGVTNSLPTIATNLSDFMTNLKPFLDGAGKIDDGLFDGMDTLVNTILLLAGASLWESITSFLTLGDGGLVGLGKKLAEFGPLFNDYYESIKDIKPDVITSTSNAMGALVTLTNSMPKTTGISGLFSGGKTDWIGMSAGLVLFGKAMMAFQNATVGLNSASIETATTAGQMLVGLENNMPETTGALGLIMGGGTDWVGMSSGMVLFGQAMMAFQNVTTGLNPESIETAVTAAEMLTKMEEGMPETTGVVGLVLGGSTDWAGMSAGLVLFGGAMLAFQNETEGLKQETIENAATAAEMLTKMEEGMPKTTGVIGLFTGGDTDWEGMSAGLVLFGAAMMDFQTKTEGLKQETIQNAQAAADILFTLEEKMPKTLGFKGLFTGGKSDWDGFGEGLVSFGEAMQKFQTATFSINPEKITNAAAAADILFTLEEKMPKTLGFKGLFTGGATDWDGMTEGLPKFGKAMQDFQTATYMIESSRLESASAAADILFALEEKMPKTLGFKGLFTGGNTDWDGMSEGLPKFGGAMKAFQDSVSDVEPSAIETATTAASILVALETTMPKTTGIKGWFTGGDTDWDGMSKGLTLFGEAISAFQDSVISVSLEAVQNGVSAADELIGLSSRMPEGSSFVNLFSGKTMSMSEFATNMGGLGDAIADFSTSVADVSSTNVYKASTSIGYLITAVEGGIPKGTNASSFSKAIKTLGTGLEDFSNSAGIINTSKIATARTSIRGLMNLAKDLASVNTTAVTQFSTAMTNVAETGIDGFLTTFSNAGTEANTAVSDMINKMKSTVVVQTPALQSAFKTLGADSASALKSSEASFRANGSAAITAFANGISASSYLAKSAASTGSYGAYSALNSRTGSYYGVGQYAFSGFVNGMGSMYRSVVNQAAYIARAAVNSAKNALVIRSPSRAFYELGDLSVQGFVNAFADGVATSYAAGSSIANNAKEGLQRSLNALSNDTDYELVISPILDTTNMDRVLSNYNGYAGVTASMASRTIESNRANAYQEASAHSSVETNNNSTQITIEHMEVRDDNDINKIAAQLDRLSVRNSRR